MVIVMRAEAALDNDEITVCILLQRSCGFQPHVGGQIELLILRHICCPAALELTPVKTWPGYWPCTGGKKMLAVILYVLHSQIPGIWVFEFDFIFFSLCSITNSTLRSKT